MILKILGILFLCCIFFFFGAYSAFQALKQIKDIELMKVYLKAWKKILTEGEIKSDM